MRDMMCRLLKRYLFSYELFIGLIFLLTFYYILNAQQASELFRKIEKLFGGKHVFHDTNDSNSHTPLPWKDTEVWSQKYANAGVYGIRGRRYSMEDRFDVMSNDTGPSIYGVFDGHGGQVWHFIIAILSMYQSPTIMFTIVYRSLLRACRFRFPCISACFCQFSAEFMKQTLLKSVMLKLLKLDNSNVNVSDLLISELVHLDKELLEIIRNTNDLSGMYRILNDISQT